jgi:hypothetical protein
MEASTGTEEDLLCYTGRNQLWGGQSNWKIKQILTAHVYCICGLRKAFNSVEHGKIITALEEHQIPTAYLETIKYMYRTCTSQVRMNNDLSKSFEIRRGVRQGDTLSPNMFNSGLEQVFRRLNNKTFIIF